jgi:hypothetical protein
MGGQVNIGGVWKDISSVSVNIGGEWKAASAIKCNIGGVWKDGWSAGLTYTADQCTGGTVLYGGVWSNQNNAFDNNEVTQANQSNTAIGNYIGYDFAADKHIRRLRIHHGSSCPSDLIVQSSANGTTWADVQAFTGERNGADQVIDIPESSAKRYWRVYAASAYQYGWDIYEIEMMEVAA